MLSKAVRAHAALALVAVLSSWAPLAAQSTAPPGGYHITTSIPSTAGGWDYALVDPAGHRLYVSHSTAALVVDLDKDSIIGTITPAPGIHGIAVAPEFSRGFTSNGRDTSVTIFDLKTLKTIGSVKVTGANPDAIVYDEASKRVFTLNHTGGSATAIDAAKGTVVGTVAIGGTIEFAQTDGKGLLFANVEDKNEVVVIDTKTATLKSRYALTGCDGPTGMAIDRAHNRVISVCGNKVMVVSDPAAGKVVATIPICSGTDAAAYDPGAMLAFASCSDGNMSVVRQTGADTYTSLGMVATQRGSRTMALDTRTHKVYMAASGYGVPAAPAAPARGGAPAVPFSILVLEPK